MKNCLFFFFHLFFDRDYFRSSIFWFFWKYSYIFRYFLNNILKFSFFTRLKFMFFLKNKTFLKGLKYNKVFIFVTFLWFFFIVHIKNFFFKLKTKMSFFFSNSFFFRKKVNFFDPLFFNKLVFFNYPSFWAAPALYALGGTYFFKDYLRIKISEYFFSAFKRFKFLAPFGFVSFLDRIYRMLIIINLKQSFHYLK